MNMAGLGYANSQLKAGVNFGSNDPRNGQLSLQASSVTGLTQETNANTSGINVSGISMGGSGAHELKMKHNSSNHSFHSSQKKGVSMMHQATNGM